MRPERRRAGVRGGGRWEGGEGEALLKFQEGQGR